MRPWNKYSEDKPRNERKPAYGITRHHTPEYHTKRWKLLRQAYLNRYPICAMCDKVNRVTAATVVDHITPISEGGDIWDEGNLQALCARCHRIKTNKEISKRNKHLK